MMNLLIRAKSEHSAWNYINRLAKKLKDDSATTSEPRYRFNELRGGYRFTDVELDEQETFQAIPFVS